MALALAWEACSISCLAEAGKAEEIKRGKIEMPILEDCYIAGVKAALLEKVGQAPLVPQTPLTPDATPGFTSSTANPPSTGGVLGFLRGLSSLMPNISTSPSRGFVPTFGPMFGPTFVGSNPLTDSLINRFGIGAFR